MENKSVWSKYLKSENISLEEDIACDVLIIGGGIAGILTAFYLSDTNLKVVLAERNQIGSGITSKMTAKVTLLQDILTKIDKKDRELYLKSQMDGMKLLKNAITTYDLECDFLKNDSYLYTVKKSNVKKLKEIEEILDKNHIKFKEEDFKVEQIESKLAIKISDSYEINPVKYLMEIKKLCKNTSIYENTNIIEVVKEEEQFLAKTSTGKKIISKKIVFATNYPYFLKPLFFPMKVRLEKSYIGYGKYVGSYENRFNAINIDKEVHSIRFYQDKMIYLTGSKLIANRVNDTKSFEKLLNSPLLSHYENIWSNMDLITSDYLPIIGKIFDDMYIITGMNTWGILSSHVGASFIASLIKKKKKFLKYQELFSPRKRITLKRFVHSSINIFESLNGFFKGVITKNKLVFYSKKEAIYVSPDGLCYVVKRKCPHMKCNLIFNEVEKTWDCPCHGSRFDLFGNVMTGPSKYDIKIEDVK